ncbi:MAG: acetyl-CoA carboxylase carboxyltransferase subunit alpha [Gammaproteobacteria bacterium]|jgi:acetyl-CoA carboxylase carboxyl transferase subunit alpha|nr:acetyl-CoA carboxylase carboxyl transferase subunit alpha [Chromatiales bacterium]MCP4925958.1 acetyl-CoA carboxylase carboxyltransferase subunit alpha [Gammaproteobacteria bacterium]MDP7153464.1 acetyl-CoA carboxylase carboxyltransferase subunit alpha [Gammaproteobacteria bacterium]MDP7418664.1 acetyl-CoA carboxylase carboxyltransferase subunit alpha [Gammaproteobacteria bacterium]HJP39117.1 acetyl-CoA carboxylase carboxyltransferase subunit alpha [Gammaproteobacteria bacterium]
MDLKFLEFEQPIAELEAKIDELRFVGDDSEVNIGDEIARLKAKSKSLTKSIFSNLTPWQIAQVARHPLRPYTNDYIAAISPDFQELHGDRMYADDLAVVGGLGRLDGKAVVFIGNQKGRNTKSRVLRNYGMAKPEGYRKALRLMKMAERFHLPVITFIDTPGAYPGIGAEERGQSEAIAQNLFTMSRLKTPIISAVVGEGGSGGALAIGVADRVLMLEYAIYSVISPEGCASILWKSAEKASLAADEMGITAERLLELGLVDEIIPEPLGSAHRDPAATAQTLQNALSTHLRELEALDSEALLSQRAARLEALGVFKES